MRFNKVILCLSFIFFSFLFCNNVSAQSVTSGIYSTAIFTKNFESSKTTYNLGPINGSSFYSVNLSNPTGFWDYVQSLAFPNPFSDKTGTGYQSSLYFTMHSTNGSYLNPTLAQQLSDINLGFEGLSEDLPYCTKSLDVRILDSSTVQFVLQSSCPYGSYPDGTVFNTVEAHVDFHPESIFWCANDNPSRLCPSSMGVTVYDIDYYFSILTASEGYQDTIINQNQTMINQDNQFYQHEYDAENNISNQSTSDISGAENQKTTDLITALGSLVGAFTSIQPASDCNIQLDFPGFAGGSQVVNPCQHKEKAPQIVLIGSSVFLVLFALKYWNKMSIKIYKVIRSFIDGTDDTEGEE